MINKEIFKNEKSKIKNFMSYCLSAKQFRDVMETLYERITNNKGKGYAEKYNVVEICNKKTFKEIKKKFKDKTSVVVEFVEMESELNGFLLIYNEYDEKNIPTKWEFYILKGEE